MTYAIDLPTVTEDERYTMIELDDLYEYAYDSYYVYGSNIGFMFDLCDYIHFNLECDVTPIVEYQPGCGPGDSHTYQMMVTEWNKNKICADTCNEVLKYLHLVDLTTRFFNLNY